MTIGLDGAVEGDRIGKVEPLTYELDKLDVEGNKHAMHATNHVVVVLELS